MHVHSYDVTVHPDSSYDMLQDGKSIVMVEREMIHVNKSTGAVSVERSAFIRGKTNTGKRWSRWSRKKMETYRMTPYGYMIKTWFNPRGVSSMRIFRDEEYIIPIRAREYLPLNDLKRVDEVYPLLLENSIPPERLLEQDRKFVECFRGVDNMNTLAKNLFGRRNCTPELLEALNANRLNVDKLSLLWALRNLVPTEDMIDYMNAEDIRTPYFCSHYRPFFREMDRASLRSLLRSPCVPSGYLRAMMKLNEPKLFRGFEADSWQRLVRRIQQIDSIQNQIRFMSIKMNSTFSTPDQVKALNGSLSPDHGIELKVLTKPRDFIDWDLDIPSYMMDYMMDRTYSKSWTGALCKGDKYQGIFTLDQAGNTVLELRLNLPSTEALHDLWDLFDDFDIEAGSAVASATRSI